MTNRKCRRIIALLLSIHNFGLEDPDAVRYLQAMIEVEDGLIEIGLLPADFMLLIGKRKD